MPVANASLGQPRFQSSRIAALVGNKHFRFRFLQEMHVAASPRNEHPGDVRYAAHCKQLPF